MENRIHRKTPSRCRIIQNRMNRIKFILAAGLFSLAATHCAAQSGSPSGSNIPESMTGSNREAFMQVAGEIENPCTEESLASYKNLAELLEAGKTCHDAAIVSHEIEFYLSHDVDAMRTLSIARTTAKDLKSPKVFNLEERPRLGDASAPVELVVFSDFQCPYCSIAAETLHKVYEARPESVSVVFKNLPLQGIHPFAAPAALVAAYAHSQGKFWEIHDRFFASQKDMSPDMLGEIVTGLGTTVDELFDPSQSLKYGVIVVEDMNEANTAGVQGTPAIFLNGVEVPSGLRYDRLIARVDAARLHPIAPNSQRHPPAPIPVSKPNTQRWMQPDAPPSDFIRQPRFARAPIPRNRSTSAPLHKPARPHTPSSHASSNASTPTLQTTKSSLKSKNSSEKRAPRNRRLNNCCILPQYVRHCKTTCGL